MKIWFISDTHTLHAELTVPSGVEIVVHCGDEANHGNPWLNEPESRNFFEWFRKLPIRHKIFVPGNHSTAIEQGLVRNEQYPELIFLIHQATELEGLKFFGSPYTPRFFDWAYMKPRQKLDEVWAGVPAGVDILITHGPPKGILDLTKDIETKEIVQVGCSALRRHVETRIKPQIHAFGHLHDESSISNFGQYHRGATRFVNASCCNLRMDLVNHGLVLDIS